MQIIAGGEAYLPNHRKENYKYLHHSVVTQKEHGNNGVVALTEFDRVHNVVIPFASSGKQNDKYFPLAKQRPQRGRIR